MSVLHYKENCHGWLSFVLGCCCFAIVVMASQRFRVNKEVAIYAICVALSMIPSALIVVLTITMAVGTQVMVSKKVIVRKLDSLEALGGINDICSDKTGTLTQGKMIAKKVWLPNVGTLEVQNSMNHTILLLVMSNFRHFHQNLSKKPMKKSTLTNHTLIQCHKLCMTG